ncbi:MAG: hypothetical protein KGH72_00660 [Candidatus Micrarchaeota archaeon]|nr:hypothetical protein [Candidatus Micrarchaeota archaeon]
MAKQTFPVINVKAAAITGAVIGFLCWLLVIPLGFSGYGMMGYFGGYGTMNYRYMGYMMGGVFHNATFGYMMNGVFYPYNATGYYPTGDIFHSYSFASVIIDIVLGALAGLAIALVYNWALKFK